MELELINPLSDNAPAFDEESVYDIIKQVALWHDPYILAFISTVYKRINTLCTNNHTYTHTFIHTNAHAYIHTCIHTYKHTHAQTGIHTHAHTCSFSHQLSYTNTYIPRSTGNGYIHTNAHAYIHTYIHTYKHTHAQTGIHTHAHTCSFSHQLSYTNTYVPRSTGSGYIHTNAHTYIHTYIHTYKHTHAQTGIHTHVHTCSFTRQLSYTNTYIPRSTGSGCKAAWQDVCACKRVGLAWCHCRKCARWLGQARPRLQIYRLVPDIYCVMLHHLSSQWNVLGYALL